MALGVLASRGLHGAGALRRAARGLLIALNMSGAALIVALGRQWHDLNSYPGNSQATTSRDVELHAAITVSAVAALAIALVIGIATRTRAGIIWSSVLLGLAAIGAGVIAAR